MKRAITLLMLATLPGWAAADGLLQPYDAQYEVQWGGMALGKAQISLERLVDQAKADECFVYTSKTKPNALVRMFYGKPVEQAQFCVEDGSVRSRWLHFSNSKQDDDFKLKFDWSKNQVRGPGDQLRELQPHSVDRFSMQEALRLWVMQNAGATDVAPRKLLMVEDDRVRAYELRISGEQRVETAAGSFGAVLVDRIDDPKKTVRFWFAPQKGYQIVRFERSREGKPTVVMALLQ